MLIPQLMMDLARRLSQVQAKVEQELPDLSHLTLMDLQDKVVSFGDKHKGKKFAQVWLEDQAWVTFMCTRYSKSRKADHRVFLRFVELKIEELEQTGQQVAVTAPTSSTSLPAELTPTGSQVLQLHPKAKAKGKMSPVKPSTRKVDMEEKINVEENSDLSESWSEAEMPLDSMTADVSRLSLI